jgi:hypothetical protein
MVLEVLKGYVSAGSAEKINIVIQIFYGEVMRMD